MSQYRLKESVAFHCFRCGSSKKSKLVTVYGNNSKQLLCNGCYGRLLSIYEVKASSASDDEKASQLGEILLKILTNDQLLEGERRLRLQNDKARFLTGSSLRFLATSEYLSTALEQNTGLEWSPAVIGLCKAVECELIEKLINPLAAACVGIDISEDVKDKDLGRVAGYCANRSVKPPELGSFAHFLQTSISSQRRRESSVLIKKFFELAGEWVGSSWILSKDGLHPGLTRLTSSFRNPAAHTEELNKDNYLDCASLVIGERGLLWELIISSQSHSKKLTI